MNYLFSFFLMFLLSCDSQSAKSSSDKIEFEEVNHFSFQLIAEQYLILDSQEKIDSVYKIIHSKTKGNRLAPIPILLEDETYLVFKPVLKSSNDVEIRNITTKNNILYIEVNQFDNPEIQKSSRASPSVLVKLLKKVNSKKIVINYQK